MEPEVAALPSSDERTFAMLAHILQLFTGFIGPLVILLIKRESRFVTFHALQALIWQAIYSVFAILGVVVWMTVIFGTIATQSDPGASKGPPVAIFLFFPLIWLLLMAGCVVTIILGIVYGVKANRGEWASYPIIGRRARRLAAGERRNESPN